MADTLEQGRDAFRRHQWTEACALFREADRHEQLDAHDLERLAIAACLVGQDAESTATWSRAHHEFLTRGAAERAARCAFWLAFGLMRQGERTRAGAWLERARGVLDECGRDCVERGYLLLPAALRRALGGDAAGAYPMFCQAAELAERFGDPDLSALARQSRGRVLIKMGDVREGVRLLDEAMIAVDAGDLSPLVVGDVYCSVIEGCLEVFDFRRAQEWTAALARWCDAQPDLVPYKGHCLVRRAEVLQLHGAWDEALGEARRACEETGGPQARPGTGAAFYRCGELLRLRGAFAEAEASYRQGTRHGRQPQPGLALLRLSQGQTGAAANSIRLALEEARDPQMRTALLPAYVEIMLANGELAPAREAAEELERFASTLDAPAVSAVAAQARGAVLLSAGDPRNALAALRHAWTAWQEVEAVYEAARVRVLIALASRDLGDADAADMEFDAARWIFQQLGAGPDLARLDLLWRGHTPASAAPLSAREAEVLRLVAAGKTNRQIATELLISERTVERHLSNIFNKIGVSTRAAATAYAYEHQLV